MSAKQNCFLAAACVAATVLLVSASMARAYDYTWSLATPGTYDWESDHWDVPANYPNGSGISAFLPTGATHWNVTSSTLTLGSLTIGCPAGSSGGQGGQAVQGTSLVFDNGTSDAVLSQGEIGTTSGTSLNFSTITLNSTLDVNCTSHITSQIDMVGTIGGPGGLNVYNAWGDSGWPGFQIHGAQTYIGGTTITNGQLTITSDSNGIGPSIKNGVVLNNGTIGIQGLSSLTSQSQVLGGMVSGTGNVYTGGNISFDNDANSWQGNLTVTGNFPAPVQFTSIKNVGGGPSALGNPQTVAEGTIYMSGVGGQTMEYTGSGDTTDRVFEISGATDGNWTAFVKASGATTVSSPFKITSDLAGNGVSWLALGGTGAGEWSGILSDRPWRALRIEKIDSGIWTLSGANTYTDETDVNDGTLQIGNGGSGESLASTKIVNNATLVFNHADALTYSGAISGNGSLIKTGSGILTLSGANNCSGPTTVSGGVLRLNSPTALSSGPLTINGGVVELANGDFQRDLGTGGGQVQITGGASGFSAYGATRAVTLGAAGSTVTWGSADFAPTTLVLNAATADSKLTLANGIDLNGTTRTIAVDANQAEITGAIHNTGATAGLTKSGNGILTLSGGLTCDGDTTVAGGELALRGSLAGLVVNDGATVTPLTGASLPTTALTMSGTASYKWLIGSSANSASLNSHIAVTGDVMLTGTPKLTIAAAGGSPNPAETYELLSYTGACVNVPAWTVDYSIVNADKGKAWQIGDGAWVTPDNWSGGTYSGGTVSYVGKTIVLTGLESSKSVPLSDSNVTIAPPNDAAVTGPSAPASVNTLQIGNGANAISLTVQSGGPLAVAGATTINQATLTLNDTLTTHSVVSSGVSTVSGSSSLGTVAAPLSSFSVPSGTTSFGGTVTVHTDALAVGGTVNLNAGSTVATKGVTGAGTVNFDGGTLKASADFTVDSSSANMNIQGGGAVINANGNTVTVNKTFAADLGDGGLTVQGSGTVLFKTAQIYTGPTTIKNGGTLQLQGVPPPVVVLNNSFESPTFGGGFHESTQPTSWDLSSGVGITSAGAPYMDPSYVPDGLQAAFTKGTGSQLGQDITFPSAGTYTISFYAVGRNGYSNPFTVSVGGTVLGGQIDPSQTSWTQYTETATVTAGVHSLIFANVNSGDVSVNFDDVVITGGGGGSNLLPTTTALSIEAGSTLDLNSASQQISSLTGSGTVTNTGGPATLTIGGTSSTFGGVISDGPGKTALTVSGGTLTLTGVNTFSGSTSITNGGMLVAGAPGALSLHSDVDVSNGVLDARTYAQTVNSLTVGGTGTLNLYVGNVLSVTETGAINLADGSTLNLSNLLNGTHVLMTYGAGMLSGTFTNTNLTGGYSLDYNYGGLNEIALVGAAASIAWKDPVSGSWGASAKWEGGSVPPNGAAVVIDKPTTSDLTITLDGARTVGTLALGSGAPTNGYILSGTDTLTFDPSATITVTDGKHAIETPVALTSGLDVSGSGTLTFSGSISGTGPLTMSGTGGTLILSGTGLYTGGTIVSAGLLAVTTSTALPDNQSLTVGAGGTLIFDPSYTGSPIMGTPVSAFAASAAGSPVSPVPEPSTLVLLLAGLAVGFGAWRRKK